MPYQFVEHRYPASDPNIDLDFTDDLIYADITGDKTKEYVSAYQNSNVIPNKQGKKTPLKKTQNPFNIYVVFLLLVIALIILWYYYGHNTHVNDKKTYIETYPDTAELTMLSPDLGMNIRYNKAFH